MPAQDKLISDLYKYWVQVLKAQCGQGTCNCHINRLSGLSSSSYYSLCTVQRQLCPNDSAVALGSIILLCKSRQTFPFPALFHS